LPGLPMMAIMQSTNIIGR